MPRPCAVESHARGYKIGPSGFSVCHGLVPWRVTLAATKYVRMGLADATTLCRGASRSLLQIRGVCIRESCAAFFVAASVRLHGARPWHPGELRSFLCSGERETPRREAVASKLTFDAVSSVGGISSCTFTH